MWSGILCEVSGRVDVVVGDQWRRVGHTVDPGWLLKSWHCYSYTCTVVINSYGYTVVTVSISVMQIRTYNSVL